MFCCLRSYSGLQSLQLTVRDQFTVVESGCFGKDAEWADGGQLMLPVEPLLEDENQDRSVIETINLDSDDIESSYPARTVPCSLDDETVETVSVPVNAAIPETPAADHLSTQPESDPLNVVKSRPRHLMNKSFFLFLWLRRRTVTMLSHQNQISSVPQTRLPQTLSLKVPPASMVEKHAQESLKTKTCRT